MRNILLAALLLFTITASAQQLATTDKTKRQVILYDDGTWKYTGPQKQSEPKQPSLPRKSAYQCESLTKKGERCKMTTTDSTHVCHIHRRNS